MDVGLSADGLGPRLAPDTQPRHAATDSQGPFPIQRLGICLVASSHLSLPVQR